MTIEAQQNTEVRDLPPSAKLVFVVLETADDDGPWRQSEIAEATMLPPRTTRHALGQLIEAGVVTHRIDPTDARRRLYFLPGEE